MRGGRGKMRTDARWKSEANGTTPDAGAWGGEFVCCATAESCTGYISFCATLTVRRYGLSSKRAAYVHEGACMRKNTYYGTYGIYIASI